MEFDTLTVSVLEAAPNPPELDAKQADALQDAHMAYLASLHESGSLQAAGPFVTPPERTIRGICLHRLPSEEVLALFSKDPAVRAGTLTVRAFTWLVPKGAILFSPTRFPHSRAEL